jgi:hypothetical protein
MIRVQRGYFIRPKRTKINEFCAIRILAKALKDFQGVPKEQMNTLKTDEYQSYDCLNHLLSGSEVIVEESADPCVEPLGAACAGREIDPISLSMCTYMHQDC